MSYHVDGDDKTTYECFKNSSKTVVKFLQSIQTSNTQEDMHRSGFVINQSQWNRLRRQALPLQLQITWLSYLKESIAQRYHMCCLLRRLQENQNDIALATLHSAEQITFNVFLAAREIMLDSQYLRDKQKQYAKTIYNDALGSLIRFRNQSLIADAEFALSMTQPSVTRMLVAVVERSIAKYDHNINKDVAQAILQRCGELTKIVLNTSIDDITEATCMQWRAGLSSHQFRLG